jgi:hypothetical protein
MIELTWTKKWPLTTIGLLHEILYKSAGQENSRTLQSQIFITMLTSIVNYLYPEAHKSSQTPSILLYLLQFLFNIIFTPMPCQSRFPTKPFKLSLLIQQHHIPVPAHP